MRTATTTTLMLAALLAIGKVEAFLPEGIGSAAIHELFAVMQSRELNSEAVSDQTAGYYEGLINEGGRVSSMNAIVSGRLGLGRKDKDGRTGMRALRLPDRYKMRGDFLYYEPHPNLDLPDYDDGGLRLVTNSAGLTDREYPLDRSPGTRRIAVLGDSVTRGQGAPFGGSYEALLEDALNRDRAATETLTYEVLNFAVSGYRLTQIVESAASKASRYKPDVYVVGLSELSLSRKWGDHLEQLVNAGVDLKYPFLRDIVQRAGLRPGDAGQTADAKLAPFRLEATGLLLNELQRIAAGADGQVVVLLVPTVREVSQLRKDFAGVPELLNQLGIPFVDLLDTFDGTEPLDRYRVSADNFHPNGEGHRRLYEELYAALRANPALRAIVLGTQNVR